VEQPVGGYQLTGPHEDFPQSLMAFIYPADGVAVQALPQARELMINNARLALRSAPPAMRPMLVEQYRMAGITIDEDGNLTE
jgi:hypothetical protein